MVLKSINPYNGELINVSEELTDNKIENLLIQSNIAFGKWKRTKPDFRRNLIETVAGLLRENIDEYALCITSEMGKPVKESRAEVEKCAWICEYYAENAERFLADEPVQTDADISRIHYEPLGTILGIMPWNFPFWQVFRFAVPTIMAGNTVVLKHASNVQASANKIEDIFTGAGFPSSVFRNLVLGSGRMEKIIKHQYINAVSVTGSAAAGQKIAGITGLGIKKTLLELGGSNAFIVFEDADLQKAAETGIRARMQNAGQSCIAAKRFIIHEKVNGQFIDLFLEGMRNIKIGDPGEENTEMGPLASIEQADIVENQVRRSVNMGATLVEGGIREKAFYTPALLINVQPGMPVFDEEVFGPVAPVSVFKRTEEALSLANETKFGLGVSVFTKNLDKARDLVSEFHDGAVFINSMVKSDPRLPFGGTGNSGYGRELGIFGIREFVNVKTVFINKT